MHKYILWTGIQYQDHHGRLGDVDSNYTGYDDYTEAFDMMIDTLAECRDDGDYAEAMIIEPMDSYTSGLWTSEDAELDDSELLAKLRREC